MSDRHTKKRFLNLPKYTGGSKDFREFIGENLRYPEAALEANIEGFVLVEYDIHDDGTVAHPRVLKGLGYGCDEEAIRVVSLLRFEKVKNRGVRVKLTTKTRINFRLPGAAVNYTVTYTHVPEKPAGKQEQPASNPATHEYIIKL